MITDYFTTSQLLERYNGISPRTIFNWRKDRGFPEPLRVKLGREQLYSRDAVLSWEADELMLGGANHG